MLVYEGREFGETVAIWVEGSAHEGYHLRRRVGDVDSGFETRWDLGRMQSRQLFARLSPLVEGESLVPRTSAIPTFDQAVLQALANLVPPAQPSR